MIEYTYAHDTTIPKLMKIKTKTLKIKEELVDPTHIAIGNKRTRKIAWKGIKESHNQNILDHTHLGNYLGYPP